MQQLVDYMVPIQFFSLMTLSAPVALEHGVALLQPACSCVLGLKMKNL